MSDDAIGTMTKLVEALSEAIDHCTYCYDLTPSEVVESLEKLKRMIEEGSYVWLEK